jgi:Na+/H+ antiporter NhaD/arsenite permease-like protein
MLSLTKVEHPETTLNYSFLSCFPFLIFFILMAMLERRKELGNHIDFNEAFKAGLGVSAVAGFVYAICSYIYFKWINHALIITMVTLRRQELEQQHKTIEEINERIVTFLTNLPFTIATYRLVELIFIGGVFSIILALIVKRKHIEVLTETE